MCFVVEGIILDILQNIYPGELLIDSEKVERYANAMMKGEYFPSPELLKVGSYTVVRDGNHRVCAWIKCFEIGVAIQMSFTFTKKDKPVSMALKQFEVIAEQHGKGVQGFKNVPCSATAEYDEKHGELHQKIYPLIST